MGKCKELNPGLIAYIYDTMEFDDGSLRAARKAFDLIRNATSEDVKSSEISDFIKLVYRVENRHTFEHYLEKVDIDSLDPDAELNRRKAAERAAELERQARIKAEEEARKEKERQKAEQEKKKKEAQKAEEEEPLNLGWNNINGQDVFISGVYGIFKIERKDDGIYVNGALVNGFSKTDSYFSYRADGRTITVYTNGEFTIEGNSKFKKYKVEDELPDDVKSLVPINSEYVEKNKLIKKAIRAREDALFELNKMERRARDRKAKLAQGITEEEAEQTKRELAEFEEKAEKAKQEMEEAEKTIAKLEEEIKKIEKGEGSEADKLKLQQQQEADEEAERQRQQQQADEEAEKKRQQQQQEDEEAEKKRQQQQQEDEAKKNSQQEEDEKKAKDEIKDDEAQDLKNDEQQKEDEQNQQATDDDVLEDPETGERERVRARDAAIVEPTRTTSKVIEHTTRHTTLLGIFNEYFGGSYMAFSSFKNGFKTEIFQRAIINFVEGSLVRSNRQVAANIEAYYQQLVDTLAAYLEVTEEIEELGPSETLDLLFKKFNELKNNTSDLLANPESDKYKAYMAYVALANFGTLMRLTMPSLQHTRVGYQLKSDLKSYNQYSDEISNMIEELGDTVKQLVSTFLAVDPNGKPIPNKYLQPKHLTSIAGKLKTIKAEHLVALSAEMRTNPDIGYRLLMKAILKSPVKSKLTKGEIETVRTLYNYLYFDPATDDDIKDLMNQNINSIAIIKRRTYESIDEITDLVIAESIDCILDKTISNEYVSLEIVNGEVTRKLSTDKNFNIRYKMLLARLNGRINAGRINDSLVEEFDITYDNKKYDKVTFTIDGNLFDVIVKSESVGSHVGDFVEVENLTLEEWMNYSQDPNMRLEEKKQNFINILKGASKLLGIDLLADNGDIIANMQSDAATICNFYIDLAGKALALRLAKNDYVLEGNTEQTIEEYAESVGLEKFVKMGRFDVLQGMKDTNILMQMAQNIAIIHGDYTAATTKNQEGKSIATSTLYNLISDARSVFYEHEQARKLREEQNEQPEFMDANYFTRNHNMIKGIIYRSDVMGPDGKVKQAKKMNASEIMYQAIFSDFFGLLAIDGTVMMEPTVFADKSGQAMVQVDMGQLMGHGRRVSEVMDSLDYEANHGMYKALRHKLIRDYSQIIQNIIANNEVALTSQDAVYINEILSPDSRRVNEFIPWLQSKGFKGKALIDLLIRNRGNVDILYEIHVTTGGEFSNYLTKKFEEYGNDPRSVTPEHRARLKREDKKLVRDFMKRQGKLVVTSILYVESKDGNTAVKLTPEWNNILAGLYRLETGKNAEGSEFDTYIEQFMNQWVDNSTDELIVYKRNGKQGTETLTDAMIYDSSFEIELNPLLLAMQSANRLLMGQFNAGMVGTPAAHEIKLKRDRDLRTFRDASFEFVVDNGDGTFDIVHETTPTPAVEAYDQVLRENIEAVSKTDLSLEVSEALAIRPDLTEEQARNLIIKNKAKEITDQFFWDEIEESARVIAMHKRMVAYQATIHKFTQGKINGVPRNMKMMVVRDVVAGVFNSIGDGGGMKVSDGGAWVSRAAAIFFKQSMGEAGTNQDSIKALRHALDSDTGAAHLDKYAIQVLGNEMMRGSLGSRAPWLNLTKLAYGSIKFSDNGIDNIFAHNVLDPDSRYEYTNDGDLFYGAIPAVLRNGGITYRVNGSDLVATIKNIRYDAATNEYVVLEEMNERSDSKLVALYRPNAQPLNYINETDRSKSASHPMMTTRRFKADSLYDLWLNLGGMWTVTEDSEGSVVVTSSHGKTLTFRYNEVSHEALVHIMTNYAIHKEGTPTDLNKANYDQPLLDCMIWQINNTTGMKNGAKNVNDSRIFTETDEYLANNAVQWFVTNSLNYGILGNFDHKFSEFKEAHVAEATQVMAAAEINGYNNLDVQRLYKAISNVIRLQMSDYYEALQDIPANLSEMLMRKLVDVMQDKERLGIGLTYQELILNELAEMEEKGEIASYDALKYKLAFSDNNFYGAMVSMVSSSLNSGAIRRLLSGIAAVISLSHDGITVVDFRNENNEHQVLTYSQFYEIKRKQAELAIFDTQQKLAELQEIMAELVNQEGVGETVALHQLVEQLNQTDPTTLSEEGYNNLIAQANDALLKIEAAMADPRIGQALNQLNDLQVDLMAYEDVAVEANQRLNNITSGKNFGEFESIEISTSEAADMYATYLVTTEDGEQALYTIDSAADYYNLRNGRVRRNGEYVNIANIAVVHNQARNLKPAQLLMRTESGEVFSDMDFIAAKLIWFLNDSAAFRHEAAEMSQQLDAFVELKGLQNKTKDQIIQALKIELLNQYFMAQNGEMVTGYFVDPQSKLISPLIEDVTPEVQAGECIMSNFNRLKFGLRAGMLVGDVTLAFFLEQMKALNPETKGSFGLAVRVNNRIRQLSMVSTEQAQNIKADTSEDFKIETHKGLKYFVDNSGNRIAKVEFEGLRMFRVTNDRATYLTYDNILTVKNMSNQDNALGVVFNESMNADVQVYINNYGISNAETIAQEMFDSFNYLLLIIGARIPAQSMQSFMAMKIVGFIEGDINRIYMPMKKNWIDGSKNIL